MSTSGTVTYSVTESDIVSDALESIGYKDPSESISADDLATARRKLNMIVKQWTSQLDFAPGLKMWTRHRAYLFLQDSQVVYSLGSSGDHATESYVTTTLSANASSSATSITVASATGISASDNIGIVLNTGAIFWTTVNGSPSGATINLASGLTSAAASGSRVFAYTTKMRRPFEIVTAVRRDTSGNDTPMDPDMTLAEYEQIYSKTSEGPPARLYFEAQRTNAKVYLDCAPDDVTQVVRMVYLSYIEDFSATTNDAEFPAEWYRALCLQLAMDCCLPFSRPIPQPLPGLLAEALAMARKAYPETIVLEYQYAPDEY